MRLFVFVFSILSLQLNGLAFAKEVIDKCGEISVIIKSGASWDSSSRCLLAKDALRNGVFPTMAGRLKEVYDPNKGYQLFLNGYLLKGSALDSVSDIYYYPANKPAEYMLIGGVSKRADCGHVYILLDFNRGSPFDNYYELDDACFDSGDALDKVDFSNGNVMIDFSSSISRSDSQRQPRVIYNYVNGKLDVKIKKGKKTVKHYIRTTRNSDIVGRNGIAPDLRY